MEPGNFLFVWVFLLTHKLKLVSCTQSAVMYTVVLYKMDLLVTIHSFQTQHAPRSTFLCSNDNPDEARVRSEREK